MLKLRIGDVAAAEKVYQTAGEAYKDINDGLAASTNIANAATSAMAVKWHAKWVKHSEIIRQVLQDWVASSDYFLIRLLSGQARESKTYTSYLGIAKAVVGEAKSRPNLLKERDLALDAKSNGSIDRDLCGLIKKIHQKVANPVGWRSPCPSLAWHRGAYWPIGYKTYNFETLLANPAADGNVTLKVAVLHDIMDVLKDHGPLAATVVPGGRDMCSILVPNHVGGHTYYNVQQNNLGPTLGFRRGDDGTLLEDSGVISSARKKKMPLSCGPSYTTGRLMQMSSWAGGTVDEITAMAWGIFAFWNQDYFTSFSGVHRFHEVMDMAKNYGVAYKPFAYPDASPTDEAMDVGWLFDQ